MAYNVHSVYILHGWERFNDFNRESILYKTKLINIIYINFFFQKKNNWNIIIKIFFVRWKKKNRFIKKIETIPITVQLLIIIGYNKFPSIYIYTKLLIMIIWILFNINWISIIETLNILWFKKILLLFVSKISNI